MSDRLLVCGKFLKSVKKFVRPVKKAETLTSTTILPKLYSKFDGGVGVEMTEK